MDRELGEFIGERLRDEHLQYKKSEALERYEPIRMRTKQELRAEASAQRVLLLLKKGSAPAKPREAESSEEAAFIEDPGLLEMLTPVMAHAPSRQRRRVKKRRAVESEEEEPESADRKDVCESRQDSEAEEAQDGESEASLLEEQQPSAPSPVCEEKELARGRQGRRRGNTAIEFVLPTSARNRLFGGGARKQ